IVIVYGIVEQYGVTGLTVATLIAGFMILAMGFAKLGSVIKFIPHPLIVGFTSGIALIIFSSQMKDFFGLPMEQMPADFTDKWRVVFENFSGINWAATGIAVFTVLLTYFSPVFSSKIPGSLFAIIISTFAVQYFQLPVETIETKFGDIPNSLPRPDFSIPDFATIKHLIEPAFTIALLGSIESLLSATVADGMIGGNHRSNTELIAQGGANIFSAIFGGIPATGAIARTVTNVKNGGRTPIAGIVHGLVLLMVMLLFAPYAKLIPLSCLAGILMVVAYHMSEWRQFKSLLKGTRMDIIILLTTFLLTVFFDLVIAIEIGIVLSSLLFMKRMSESVAVKNISSESVNGEFLFDDEQLVIPPDVLLYEINGPLFFGAARQFQETVMQTRMQPRVIILRMRYVPLIDATGFQSLKAIIKWFTSKGIV